MPFPFVYGDYEILDSIADESNTQVFKAVHVPTGTRAAIKVPKEGCEQTLREANIVSRIEHDVILPLLDGIQSEFGPALVYPLCEGGDLLKFVERKGRLPEHEANIVMFQILTALRYLHVNHIWHRDIKPENILLVCDEITPDSVKLADLGLAVITDSDVMYEDWVGTCQYASPEMICARPYSNTTDIFSLGRTLYVILCGEIPENIDLNKLKNNFGISDDCINLLAAMLDPDPETRITAETAREHRWFNDWWGDIFGKEIDGERMAL
jgi:serine/threonine protein kinase